MSGLILLVHNLAMNVHCPQCRAALTLCRRRLPRTVRCPACGGTFRPGEDVSRAGNAAPGNDKRTDASGLLPETQRSTAVGWSPGIRHHQLTVWILTAVTALLVTGLLSWGGVVAVRKVRASQRAAQAVAAAEAWLAAPQPGNVEPVEQCLHAALAAQQGARDEQIRTLLAQVHDRTRQQQAEETFTAAEQAIAANDLPTAIQLLEEYFGQPLGKRKVEASRLLDQAKLVNSPAEITKVLQNLSPSELQDFRSGGKLPPTIVSGHPGLLKIFQQALRKNLSEEIRRREELQSILDKKKQPAGDPPRLKVADEVRNSGSVCEWNGRLLSIDNGHCRVRVDYVNALRKTPYEPGHTYDFLESEVTKQRGRNPLKAADSTDSEGLPPPPPPGP